MNQILRTAPILTQYVLFGSLQANFFLHLLLQQPQVASTPAVDRLLDISNNQASVILVKGVAKQGPEILPLQFRGVLEFIDQVMAIKRSDFFINKRGIAVVNDAIQKMGGVGEQHQVVFGFVVFELSGNIG